MSQNAKIRVCARCEWIFDVEKNQSCAQCDFGASYGARFVYGKDYLALYRNQTPWKEKRLAQYITNLEQIIDDNSDFTSRKKQ